MYNNALVFTKLLLKVTRITILINAVNHWLSQLDVVKDLFL